MSSITPKIRTSVWVLASRITFPLLATMGVLLLSLPLFSQGNFGSILGIVADQTGGVISGATVTIIDKDRGVARTLITDNAGEYNAPTLNPSTYTVRVEARGFKKLERQNVVLEVGKEVRIDVTVQPGEQTQTVTVTESIPLVETTNATLGGTLSNADINDIPLNGRLYQNLMSLRPGVVTQPGGSPWTQSTNGSRPDETVWLLEGVISTNFFDARPLNDMPSPFTDGGTILPIDAIQEFTMEENPKAEYGWRPGAVVNVGIRSGTNTLHGSAYAFGRDAALDARDAFNPGPDANGVCVPNPTFKAQCNKLATELKQFGATVGGPIKKDKLFFFAGYEGLRSLVSNLLVEAAPATGAGLGPGNSMPDAIKALQTAGANVLCSAANQLNCLSPASLAIFGCAGTLATVGSYSCTGSGGPSGPAANGLGLWGIQNAPSGGTSYQSNFPNRNTSDNGIAKMDYRINSKHMINGVVAISNYTSLGEDHAIANGNWENSAPIKTKTFTGNWIYSPGSSVVNDVRLSYNRMSFQLLPGDANLFADGTSYPINTGIKSIGGFPSIFMNPFGTAGGDLLGSWRGRPLETFPNPYYDLQESLSYLRGKHSFKFGGEFAHIEADSFVHDTRGRIDFKTGNTFAGSTSLEDFFAGNPGSGTLLVGNPNLKLRWTSTAVFAQDDWRVTPKLMINLGLRYSYVQPFKEANNNIGNFDPTSVTGLVQQGQAGLNTLIKPDRKNFSPRLGFAWDVTGKGTTVIRGGGSIIYSTWQMAAFFANPGPAGDHNHQTSPAAVPTGFACAVAPSCPNGTFGGTIQTGVVSIKGSNLLWNGPADTAGGAGIFPSGLAPSCGTRGGVGTCDLFAIDPNLKNPYVLDWSFGITHAFNNNLSLEVGYVGNHGYKLSEIRDINAYNVVNGVTTTVQPYAAQFPYFDAINYVSNNAHSNYNSLQATLTERVTHGLSFTGGYTYSHGLDNGSLSRFGGLPQNQANPLGEYASGDLDLRHRFTLTGSYAFPGKKGFGQLLEGWKINSVVSIQTGLPWLPIDTGNNFSADAPRGGEQTLRWDFFGNPTDFTSGKSSLPYCTGPGAGGCSQTSGISGIVTPFTAAQSATMWNQCLAHAADTSAGGTLLTGGCFVSGNSVMTPPASNTFGNMGRNTLRDSGFKNWDFSIFKTFTFKERFGAQFRFEVFNLLNHPIISNPYGAAVGYNGGSDPSAPSTFGCGCATPDIANGNALVGSGGPRVMQLGLKLTF
jgi:outer membrane receptor protein involved in Fe transport